MSKSLSNRTRLILTALTGAAAFFAAMVLDGLSSTPVDQISGAMAPTYYTPMALVVAVGVVFLIWANPTFDLINTALTGKDTE